MPLILQSPHDKSHAIDLIKSILVLWIFPGLKGSHADVHAWVDQMEASPGIDVKARFETFPSRKRTVVTLTFDQVETKLNG